jgi:hypothetical protein
MCLEFPFLGDFLRIHQRLKAILLQMQPPQSLPYGMGFAFLILFKTYGA